MLGSLAEHYGFDLNTAWEDLTDEVRTAVLHGSGKDQIAFIYMNERGSKFERIHSFEGIIPNLERRYRETDSMTVREELAKYQNNQPCPSCGGSRLRREARFVKVGTETLHAIAQMALRDASQFFLPRWNLKAIKRRSLKKSSRKSANAWAFWLTSGLIT